MRKTLHIVVALVTLFWLSGMSGVFAQLGTGRPFITKWQGTKDEELKIPIVGTYKMVIKDGNGNEKVNETVTVEDSEHPYVFTPTEDGTYTVEAGPEGVKYMQMKEVWKYETEKLELFASYDELLEVVQFGTVKWASMEKMFSRCKNMTFAEGIDTPDLSNVTNMAGMFAYCSSFNQPLGKWDMSNVTDMDGMFSGCSSFNQPLNNWNVSKVTDMDYMFYHCSAFNQPLNNWNLSNVTSMRGVFSGCSSFNQPLNNWIVSKVTNMSGMFLSCSSFNQPIGNWKVDNVTNMQQMFEGCSSFNQPLNDWNVSKVKYMIYLFSGCSSFNQPLGNWNVSNVTDMNNMFEGCYSFNQPLGSWKIKTHIGGLSTTAMSPSNYSQTLVGWAGQTDIAANINTFVYALIYNDEGKVARQKLIDKGWTFYRDIHQPSGVAITPSHPFPLVLNKECTLPLEKWGVEETEEVTLSTNREGIISYELTADKKGVHIKGLKKGWCLLTATIAAKPGVHEAYTSTCIVEVYIPIERITISPASKTLKVGEGVRLTAKFFPENATKREVEWECYKTEIATVDNNGKVTGHKAGTCWIYAKIHEYGRTVYGKCKVTVVNEIAPVTSIRLLEKQTLTVGTIVPLIAVVKPDNAEQGLVWSSSDPEIAMVSEGIVWGKKKGECTITVKSLDPTCSITKECKITVEEPSNGGNLPTFKVTLAPAEHGKIAIEGHGTENTITVAQGTTLTVTETPDEGYKLKTLTAGNEDITNSKQFTVKAATEVKAVFEKETFQITPEVTGEGCSLTFKNATTDAAITNLGAVPYGTTVKVVPISTTPWVLSSLMVGNQDITTTQSFVLKSKVTVYAVFQNKNVTTFRVTVTQTEGGTIAILGYTAAALEKVSKDTELTVTVTPDEGYKLKTLTAGDEDITNTKQFIVKAATEVKAVFEKETFKVNENIVGTGALRFTDFDDQPLDPTAVPYGTAVRVVPVENDPWKLKSLSANGKDIFAAKEFIIKEATTVKAVFEKSLPKFTVTLTQPTNGKIAIEGHGMETTLTVEQGTTLTVTVTHDEGYKLKSLKAGDEDITNSKQFTVKAATEVKAVFEKESFVVKTSVNDEKGGEIALSGASDLKAVEYGTELTVKVTENKGYELKELKANDEDIIATKKFVVKAATEVKAVFESKQGGAVEDALLAGIAVAPNPFSAQLRILNPEGVAARYEVVNAIGVVVRSGALSGSEAIVDTETLSAGIYFVRIEAQNGARKSVMVSK